MTFEEHSSELGRYVELGKEVQRLLSASAFEAVTEIARRIDLARLPQLLNMWSYPVSVDSVALDSPSV
jgi:hypothetical protein